MKCLIVYSTFSGKKGIQKKVDYISQELSKKYEVFFHKSNYNGSIIDYIADHGSEFDLIVTVGGDGTIHQAINGLMKVEKKPKIAFVPAGTVNDEARSLGLKRNIKKTVKIILEGHSAKLDLHKINNEYFIYSVAAGCMSEVSYSAKRNMKKFLGKIAYFFECLARLVTTKAVEVKFTSDKMNHEGKLSAIVALNTRYLAGFKLHGKNRIYLNDGYINVVMLKKTLKLVNLFDFGLFLLFGDRYKHNIKFVKTKSCAIESKYPITYCVDGEKFDPTIKIEIDTVNNAIEVILQEKILNNHFFK